MTNKQILTIVRQRNESELLAKLAEIDTRLSRIESERRIVP
jgi:hypothetical protein